MKKVVVIMAGGKGTRLWPISKKEMPKQFLKLTEENNTMLELTVERALHITEPQDIYIVTQPEYVEIAQAQILNVPKTNILSGPNLKSTTEAIAFTTAAINEKYEDAIAIILPADHVIKNMDLFIKAIDKAEKISLQNYIVTLGITPEFPETNYGYIEKGEVIEQDVYKVKKFKEKPVYEIAEKYFEDDCHLWNSGIFIWKNSVIAEEIRKYLPHVYSKIKELSKLIKNSKSDFKNIFENIQTKSIDYDILEKTNKICVVKSQFYWNDVGNLKALHKEKKKDTNNNVIEGKNILYNSKNNMVISKNKTIVACGVENLIIIESENEILVTSTLNDFNPQNNILTNV